MVQTVMPRTGTRTIEVKEPMEGGSLNADAYYIAQCVAGDRQAFATLYRRHVAKVRSTLYQLCGADVLDDLVQEVFLRAWKGLKSFRQTAQFSTWLYRITWNVACDRRRELARGRTRQVQTDPEHLQALADAAIAKGGQPSPLSQIHYQDVVRRGLSQLNFERRSVLVLHDLENLPQKDVAIVLGIPVGTVKSRLFHARQALRQYLEAEGIEP
jgi:RNA polymerase sigma-70 factor (ECF subfamily)